MMIADLVSLKSKKADITMVLRAYANIVDTEIQRIAGGGAPTREIVDAVEGFMAVSKLVGGKRMVTDDCALLEYEVKKAAAGGAAELARLLRAEAANGAQ